MAILQWYLLLLLFSLLALPLSARIFRGFADAGYFFGRMLLIFLSAMCFYTMNTLRVFRFAARNAYLLLFLILIGILCVHFFAKKSRPRITQDTWLAIAEEEGLFLLLFVVSLWIIAFRGEAHGIEKFMDYGFLNSIMHSEYMPAADPWFAGEGINYYYGNQYISAFLAILSRVTPGEAYNLMRATVWAASFLLPYAFVRQLAADANLPRVRLAAAVSGSAVAFAGNAHFIYYGLFQTVVSKVRGIEYSYWFPDSTRFIGYQPDVDDKTIHEFPSYASILGDLHGHFVNILFTICIVAVAYAYMRRVRGRSGTGSFLKDLLSTEIWLIGLVTGLFRFTNFWDFPIYFVVCGTLVLFANLSGGTKQIGRGLLITLLQAAFVFLLGKVAALPFTKHFAMISSEILPVMSRTPIWQLAILWGARVFCVCVFMAYLILWKRANQNTALKTADLALLLLFLCALGLLLMPELIYVKDIYTASHHRSNTMFKLTYQAFILLNLGMGYVICRLMAAAKKNNGQRVKSIGARICAAALCLYLALACLYTPWGVREWFGNVFDASARKSIDASSFIEEDFASDAPMIAYLQNEVAGQPVILEANGDSFSDYERISVATGLPTVLGWRTHEWLWRGDTDILDARAKDIETIYTGVDPARVQELLMQYDVSYICIGKYEHEKFTQMNERLLHSMGEVVVDEPDAVLIKVRKV